MKQFLIIVFVLISVTANAQFGVSYWGGGHHHRDRFGMWWGMGPFGFYPYPYSSTPNIVVVPQTTQVTSLTPPTIHFWYYCAAAEEYYPHVPTCPGGWKAVPAVPPK